jgi:CheY-like chemotaxis protein/two-component sensor histidine kinase
MKNRIESGHNLPNILVVDDVPANLKLLDDILNPEGYKIRLAPGGVRALRAADNDKPDLILLDIMMPDMDGFEVCRQLKEHPDLKDIPVIFISALNDTANIVKALKAGGVDYINKPFQAEEVLARVHTHLKLRRQSCELQELIAAKDKFFTIIAHDLRGPLISFMGLTQILADKDQDFPQELRADLANELSDHARNTFNLLENLLQWSQMERGLTDFNPEILDLEHVVAQCIKTAADTAHEKQIRITTDILGNPEVFADTNMLQTVIRNLVSNAVKFTPEGGSVTISSVSSTNSTILLSVKDTGIGMDAEMQKNIFRIDVDTKRPGTNGERSTGMGLLLCKEFVEKQGGQLWVESTKDEGSAFYFTIPSPIPNEVKKDDKTVVKTAGKGTSPKKLTILLVDDDEISNRIIPLMLKELAREVMIVKTGVEAIEFCRSNPVIDLVLMDIFMPEMNGLETTRQIRQFNKEIVIIAQTAFVQNGAREMSILAGCDDYISKPFSKAELLDIIKKNVTIHPGESNINQA